MTKVKDGVINSSSMSKKDAPIADLVRYYLSTHAIINLAPHRFFNPLEARLSLGSLVTLDNRCHRGQSAVVESVYDALRLRCLEANLHRHPGSRQLRAESWVL